jgi:hypothetical protein
MCLEVGCSNVSLSFPTSSHRDNQPRYPAKYCFAPTHLLPRYLLRTLRPLTAFSELRLCALYPTGGLERDTNIAFTTDSLAALDYPEYVDGLSHQQQ